MTSIYGKPDTQRVGVAATPTGGNGGVPAPGDIYSRALNNLRGWGNAAKSALYQSYQNALGMGMQNLTSSGLSGTTLAPSMRMGYMKQYQQSLNELGDKLAMQRANVESTVGFQAIAAQQASEGLDIQRGQLGVQQGYLGIAGKAQAAQESQFASDLSLRRQLGMGQLGVQQGQLDLQKLLGLGSQNLQQGYLGLANKQFQTESSHWDIQRQDARDAMRGYGGWSGGGVDYSNIRNWGGGMGGAGWGIKRAWM